MSVLSALAARRRQRAAEPPGAPAGAPAEPSQPAQAPPATPPRPPLGRPIRYVFDSLETLLVALRAAQTRKGAGQKILRRRLYPFSTYRGEMIGWTTADDMTQTESGERVPFPSRELLIARADLPRALAALEPKVRARVAPLIRSHVGRRELAERALRGEFKELGTRVDWERHRA